MREVVRWGGDDHDRRYRRAGRGGRSERPGGEEEQACERDDEKPADQFETGSAACHRRPYSTPEISPSGAL